MPRLANVEPMLTVIQIGRLLEDMRLYQSKLEFGEILVRNIQPLLQSFLRVTEWFTLRRAYDKD